MDPCYKFGSCQFQWRHSRYIWVSCPYPDLLLFMLLILHLGVEQLLLLWRCSHSGTRSMRRSNANDARTVWKTRLYCLRFVWVEVMFWIYFAISSTFRIWANNKDDGQDRKSSIRRRFFYLNPHSFLVGMKPCGREVSTEELYLTPMSVGRRSCSVFAMDWAFSRKVHLPSVASVTAGTRRVRFP